mgnify:CR=1 FL=1
MKKEFVSTVSHELRTPLTSLSGAISLLRGGTCGELPAAAQRLLQIAHDNGLRLNELINDLLDMSKIESGMLTTEQTCFSLDETIAGLLDIYSTEAHRKGLRLQIDRADDVPDLIRTDPLRLHQVLSNLLSNAVKFTDAGRVSVSVVLRDLACLWPRRWEGGSAL